MDPKRVDVDESRITTHTHLDTQAISDESTESGSMFQVGHTVCGYQLLRVLGHGGMGIVFAAVDRALGREVAIKVMRRDVMDDPVQRGRFLRETKVTASLEHDNVVRIYNAGEFDGQPFLVMELLAGEPLNELLKRRERLPLEKVLRIARDIARGLAAAHERGLVHRDVAPGNAWIEPSGRAKLLDFGLVHDPDPGAARLTRAGAVMGTPGYMSPEQAMGEQVTYRSDLFGLGCILYLLATGTDAYPGSTSIDKLLAVRTHNPIPPHDVDPEVPTPIARLITELLARTPADRPRTAEEVAERLSGLLADLALPEDPEPVLPPVHPRRHSAGAKCMVTALLTFVVTASLFLILLRLGYLARLTP